MGQREAPHQVRRFKSARERCSETSAAAAGAMTAQQRMDRRISLRDMRLFQGGCASAPCGADLLTFARCSEMARGQLLPACPL